MNVGLTGLVSDYYLSGLYQQNNVANMYNGLSFSNVLAGYMSGQSYGNLWGNGYLGTNLTNGTDCSIVTQNIGTSKMSIVIPDELRAKMLTEGEYYCIRLDEKGEVADVTTTSQDMQAQATSKKKTQGNKAQENKVRRVAQLVGEHNHMFGNCNMRNRIEVQV